MTGVGDSVERKRERNPNARIVARLPILPRAGLVGVNVDTESSGHARRDPGASLEVSGASGEVYARAGSKWGKTAPRKVVIK